MRFFLASLLLFPFSTVAGPLGSVMVHDAWAPPSIPGQKVGVAYITLHNPSDAEVAVKNVTSPQAARVEVHTHEQQADGVMQMKRLDALLLPAGQEVAMAPGGLHLMLFDPVQSLKEGDRFLLTLSDGAETLPVEVSVRSRNSADKGHSGHEMGDKHGHHH